MVECKSCKADYQAVPKWQGYLEWCDRFFWAVDSDFPIKLLPDSTGVILADAYDTEITRMAPLEKLAAARRKKGGGGQKFATQAARRLQNLRDPDAGRSFKMPTPHV